MHIADYEYTSSNFINRVADLIEEKGDDAWWNADVKELLQGEVGNFLNLI